VHTTEGPCEKNTLQLTTALRGNLAADPPVLVVIWLSMLLGRARVGAVGLILELLWVLVH
jgi:hypothetical protein